MSGELDQGIADEFTKKTGIRVTVDTYDSNESLIAKLEAGASGYDLVQPSQYAVQILAKKGLLAEMDHGKLKSFENIGEVFRSPSFDPGLKNGIPYYWGTTGLTYNDSCVDEPVTSWKALWDPKYKGPIYMLDNMLAAYIAGLQVNGFSANTSDPEEIRSATQSLIEQKPQLAGYNSTNFSECVSSGEACTVEARSGSVAVFENPDVHSVIPDEGGTMWLHSFAIVKDAPHPENAYKFLGFMLRPEIAAKNLEIIGSTVANDGAKALLDPIVASNPAIYPPPERLANCDIIRDVGEAMKDYQEGWTEVKADSE